MKNIYTVMPGRWIARDGTPIFAIMLNNHMRENWENFGPADADKMAHTVVALLNNEPHTMTGDTPPSPEFLNALRVYRSPDDAEMSLADQFKVIADRIEEAAVDVIDHDRIQDGVSKFDHDRAQDGLDPLVAIDDDGNEIVTPDAEFDDLDKAFK